jgi:hypothetical protein
MIATLLAVMVCSVLPQVISADGEEERDRAIPIA